VNCLKRILAFIETVVSRSRQLADQLLVAQWRVFDRSRAAVSVFLAVPVITPKLDTLDSGLPEPLRSFINNELRERIVGESALAPVIQLGAKGVSIEAVLRNSTAPERPLLVLIEPAKPYYSLGRGMHCTSLAFPFFPFPISHLPLQPNRRTPQ